MLRAEPLFNGSAISELRRSHVFDGHPHLVKLLLPEQFEGHPLRKDFALMTREAKPWPGAVEGEEIEE